MTVNLNKIKSVSLITTYIPFVKKLNEMTNSCLQLMKILIHAFTIGQIILFRIAEMILIISF